MNSLGFICDGISNIYDRMRINEKRKKERNPFLRSLIDEFRGAVQEGKVKDRRLGG
jgi:hypothetical protein